MTGALDLTGLPFVDAHMHPPYRDAARRPGRLSLALVRGRPARLGPRRRDRRLPLGDPRSWRGDLGCEPDEQAVFDIVRRRDPAEWLAELVRRDGVAGLVADMGYPPPGETFSPAELRRGRRSRWRRCFGSSSGRG